MRLSHHDLSCMVACTRVAVSQAMGELREAGLIETPRPCRVVVLDEPRLSKVAMGQAITAQDEFAGIPQSSRGRARIFLERKPRSTVGWGLPGPIDPGPGFLRSGHSPLGLYSPTDAEGVATRNDATTREIPAS
jgi:hypothetical protein